MFSDVGNDVAHLHGVTRSALGNVGNLTLLDDVENQCLEQLAQRYDDYFVGFGGVVEKMH